MNSCWALLVLQIPPSKSHWAGHTAAPGHLHSLHQNPARAVTNQLKSRLELLDCEVRVRWAQSQRI